MANAPDNASDFVSDFDQEVGVLRRDLEGVYLRTKDWPEFMDYERNDEEPHILYEGEVPVRGKAYSHVGWYLILNPSKREFPETRYDYQADIQFQYDEAWHNYSDWYNVVCKWQLPKVDPSMFPPFWRVSKEHAELAYASLKKFVDEKLSPVLMRENMNGYIAPVPTLAKTLAETVVSTLLGEYEGQAQYRCKWCDKTHSLDAVPRTWRELSHFFASQDIYDVKCYKQGGTWVLQAGSRSIGLGLRNLKWMTFGDWLKNYHYLKKGIAQDRAADDAHERWAQTRFNNPNDEEEYAGDPVNAS